jgi:hypothetical protein
MSTMKPRYEHTDLGVCIQRLEALIAEIDEDPEFAELNATHSKPIFGPVRDIILELKRLQLRREREWQCD